MNVHKSNPVVDKSFALALEIIDLTYHIRDKKQFDLASQIFRCGTSIGANIREAQGAESKKDFIHKLKISFKETEELDFWLELCDKSKRLISPSSETKKLLVEVRKLLSSIISSSKK